MGYGNAIPEPDICALVDQLVERAFQVARPSFYCQIVPCELGVGRVKLGDQVLSVGGTIAKLLRGSQSVALFVATAGEAFQRWLDEIVQSGDTLSMFISDAIGSALVESVGDYMELQLDGEIAPLLHTNRFSPGYCGWNIEQQQLLFSLLPEHVCGVELNANSLMYPIKSISGIVGIGESVDVKKYGCSICGRVDCYIRKGM